MYVSIKDKFTTANDVYDTVKCAVQVWNQNEEHTSLDFTVEDYYSTKIFYDSELTGTNQSAFASYLDTAQSGTTDWYLSTFQDDNTSECTDSWCKITCVAYRELITDDKTTDVQFSKSSSVEIVAGFNLWDTRISTTDSGLSKGKSELTEIEYGAASALLASLSSVAALFALTSF